ncbi:MAG: tetratricopeptide repeat protein, partial [Ardenticatenaceae bacterium]
ISVLNYGFGASQQPYFTMTYLPEAQTLLEAGMARDQVGKVQLIREMLQALAYLHRRGIIHRDLKPSNVLVAENNLRVLDFGLSISQETKLTSAGGTLLYMAPELLNQQAATQASDLYAVGVMAYQLFAGRHPFDTTSYAFVDQVLYEAPDLTILGLDERLANVIARLLAKKPAERYVSAEACLRAIHAALGEAIPAESAAIRESYLQAATFVGREAEMAQLQAALTEAKDGQGAVWLVGGESGVGKSRLVAEFRTQALVSGWQVLTGQAIAEGGGPYHLWREIVRRLVLNTQLSDLEAGILYQVAPDIAHLLARPIPEPPELHGEAGQLRLVLTLVSIIQRQTQPTLLLVEDLQWAQESLAPLQQVLKVDGQMTALMVVGTYRNDERPNLPEILAGSQGFVLDRLTEPQIAQLSQAMLGKEASTARIVSLLTQETEGNTFFIVEVMRALAEEAGQLDEIGQMTLPAGVFTSGMQHLLQRRVQRIGVEDQALLKLAAIAGRQLDANLLQVLAPDTDIAAWLQRTSDAAILAVGDGQWLFAHDKLREAILAGLVAETQQDLHRQVAEAIEQLYPQDETYYEALLEQWHQAGDLDKEIHYLDPVVRHLIQVAIDYEQAHILLERSLQALAEDDARRVSIWNWQATFHQLQGNHDHAKRLAQQAQELATKSNNQSGLALTLKILGDFNIYYGDYTSASEYHQQSLTIYQKIRDQGNIANSLIRLGDMARFQGNFALARTYYQKTLKMGQSLNEKAIIAQSVNNLGIVAAQTGKYEQGRDYFQQALILRQAIGNQYAIASGLCNLGQITYDLGDYQQAYDYIQQSMVIAEAIGDQQTIVYNLTALAFLDIKLNNGQAKASLCKLLSVARSSQAIPTMLEALVGFIWLFLQQHNPVRAGELAGLTQHHPAHNSDVQQKLNEVLPLLSESLDGMELQAALERGKTFDLDTVVQALLSEFSNNQKDDKD